MKSFVQEGSGPSCVQRSSSFADDCLPQFCSTQANYWRDEAKKRKAVEKIKRLRARRAESDPCTLSSTFGQSEKLRFLRQYETEYKVAVGWGVGPDVSLRGWVSVMGHSDKKPMRMCGALLTAAV